MDYLLPVSTDMPPKMELAHLSTPSPLNQLGAKGIGEAGAIPTPAAFASAVENALKDEGVEILESPLDPCRLWQLVQQKQ
jgi:CO/xanthine dehydrogenase Mo-binding subunit